jgi:large subunit ribosomal protein L13
MSVVWSLKVEFAVNIMKTYTIKEKDIKRKWYLIDARDMVLGRLASEVANILRGKNKPEYSPHLDLGDNVIIVNADKVVLTGNKLEKKMYYHHSGYPGGLKKFTYAELMGRKPDFVVRKAVKGMLPHNRLGRSMLRKLHVYAGPDHPHQAQKPERLGLEEAKKK